MLVKVHTCQNAKLLEITSHGSFILKKYKIKINKKFI